MAGKKELSMTKSAIASRKWRANHIEKAREIDRQRIKKNPEKERARRKRYYEKNKQKVLEYAAKYRRQKKIKNRIKSAVKSCVNTIYTINNNIKCAFNKAKNGIVLNILNYKNSTIAITQKIYTAVLSFLNKKIEIRFVDKGKNPKTFEEYKFTDTDIEIDKTDPYIIIDDKMTEEVILLKIAINSLKKAIEERDNTINSLEAKNKGLSNGISTYHKKVNELDNIIKDYNELQSIYRLFGTITITFHAFVRFLERYQGKNVEKIFKEIVKEYRNNPSKFVIQDNAILTFRDPKD